MKNMGLLVVIVMVVVGALFNGCTSAKTALVLPDGVPNKHIVWVANQTDDTLTVSYWAGDKKVSLKNPVIPGGFGGAPATLKEEYVLIEVTYKNNKGVCTTSRKTVVFNKDKKESVEGWPIYSDMK